MTASITKPHCTFSTTSMLVFTEGWVVLAKITKLNLNHLYLNLDCST